MYVSRCDHEGIVTTSGYVVVEHLLPFIFQRFDHSDCAVAHLCSIYDLIYGRDQDTRAAYGILTDFGLVTIISAESPRNNNAMALSSRGHRAVSSMGPCCPSVPLRPPIFLPGPCLHRYMPQLRW